MNRAIARRVAPYSTGHLLDEIRKVKYNWLKYNDNIDNCKLYMSNISYQELKKEISMLAHITDSRFSSVLGLDIEINNRLEPFTFMIKEDREMDFNNINIPNMFGGYGFTPRNKKNLPKKYIINK